MASLTIEQLLEGHNLIDFGADRAGNVDAGPAINEAFAYAARKSPGYGIIFAPPGTYRIDTPIVPRSGILLAGFGSVTVFKLGPSKNVNVLQAESISNLRLRDFRIDGNRANNTGGTGNGIYLEDVQDGWIDGVEVVSCRSDGIQLVQTSRLELRGCRSSDNGRHGIGMNYTEFCFLVAPRCFDNCQVSTAGVGDGINLDLLSHDNVILSPVCYETSLAGVLQGYGVREQSGGGCYRNQVIGGAAQGNRTAPYLLEPDSLGLSSIGVATGNLGVGTQTPEATALLDLVSTTRGFLPPRMTTAQKASIASPADGLCVYDTDLAAYCVYNGSSWVTLTAMAFAAPGLTLGTANAEGDAGTAIRSNATVLAFDATAPTTGAFGAAAAAGAAAVAARRDHTHGFPAADETPSTQAFGDSASVGTSAKIARADHKHAIPADPVTAHNVAAAVHGLGASVNVLGDRNAAGEYIQHGSVSPSGTYGSADTAVVAGSSFSYPQAFAAILGVLFGAYQSADSLRGVYATAISTTGVSYNLLGAASATVGGSFFWLAVGS